MVVLLRATTHIGFYERALEERGIPTYVLGGRGYWSQQQVADLRAYLAALANPRDELALYSVLASPLVGASLDALAVLGPARPRVRPRPVVGARGGVRGTARTALPMRSRTTTASASPRSWSAFAPSAATRRGCRSRR